MAALVLQTTASALHQAVPRDARAPPDPAESLLAAFDADPTTTTTTTATVSPAPAHQGPLEELQLCVCTFGADLAPTAREHPSIEGKLRLFAKAPPRASDEPHGWHVFIPALPPAMAALDIAHMLGAAAPHIASVLVLRGANLSAVVRCRSAQGAREVLAVFNGQPVGSEYLCLIALELFLLVDESPRHTALGLRREFPICPHCLARLDPACDEHIATPDPTGRWPLFHCTTCAALAAPRLACQACPSQRALWVCLVCAYVGCSRRQHGEATASTDFNEHSLRHFEATQGLHSFAVDKRTLEVWDYSADKYVHRTTELRGAGKKPQGDGEKPPVDAGKEDMLAAEYVTLLEGQLGAQAAHFSEQRRLLDEAFAQREQALLAAIATSEAALAPLETDLAARRAAVEERQAAAKSATAGFMAAMTDLRAIKQDTDALHRQQDAHRAALAREAELKESECRRIDQVMAALRDQIADLETHFQTTLEIERAPPHARAALESGHLVLGPGDSPAGSTPARRGRRGRK